MESDVVQAEAFDPLAETETGGLVTLPPFGFAALSLRVKA